MQQSELLSWIGDSSSDISLAGSTQPCEGSASFKMLGVPSRVFVDILIVFSDDILHLEPLKEGLSVKTAVLRCIYKPGRRFPRRDDLLEASAF